MIHYIFNVLYLSLSQKLAGRLRSNVEQEKIFHKGHNTEPPRQTSMRC